ncbi:MAG: PQQ-binding-like beta-propeller repeat protein [candidate division WOR-3 bacterium]|nr:PQQ-binding-like beta-propeller repeat protein [candidate division WOR-3 bacterium]
MMRLNRVILTTDALLLIFLVACEDGLFKKKGAIEVQSTPEGAEVYLNGEHTGEATNCVLDDIEPGEHSIKLTLSGYWDWESNVTVKVGDTAFVHALFTTEEGSIKWKFESSETYPSRTTSTAIGSDQKIYYATRFATTNVVYAVTAKGTEHWSDKIEPTCWVFSPVVSLNKGIYVKAYDFERDKVTIFVYPATGEPRSLSNRGSTSILDFFDETLPVIGSDGTLYCACEDSTFCAFTPTLREKWTYKVEEGNSFSSAAIGSDGTIYFSVEGYNKSLYALTPQGDLKWKREGLFGSPAIGSNGTIYLYGGYGVKALNPDGSEKWRLEDVAEQIAIGSDGTIYASYGSYVNAISNDGILLGQFHPDDEYRRFNYPMVGSDDVIYIGASDGYLYALNPDCSLRWKCYIGEEIDGSPAIADDGTIYCATQDGNLYAITSSSRGLASSPWPKYAHDNQNTGRAGAQ